MTMEIPIIEIKGVGPETAKDLEGLQIATVEDLFEHFPYRYENYEVRDLSTVKHDEKITVEGKVHSEPSLTFFNRKKSRLTVRVFIDRYLITAVIFNRSYLKKQLQIGETVTITGKWDQHRASIAVAEIKKGKEKRSRVIEPVYAVKGNVGVKQLRKIMSAAFAQYATQIVDALPEQLRTQYKLMDRVDALKAIHFPLDFRQVKQARRRLVYEELLLFQLRMQAFKMLQRREGKGSPIPVKKEDAASFISKLPFPLTQAQQRVMNEILSDLKKPYHMNRLLQGDVGSGKTVVAAIALFAVAKAGFQGALMVPTEILAEQHEVSLKALLEHEQVKVALLTSTVKGKRRRELTESLKNGEIDVLVGTHALIQDDVAFHNLGLVITDEQHRFGVVQRRTLSAKGNNPDVLHMTATPIPRTLAISAFGDMDVSTIDELPAGRKEIRTFWAKHDMLERVLTFVDAELQKGRQAYVICPLIEESDQLDVQNAIDVHGQLQHYFQKYNVGLMHGRLSPQEKEEVMVGFKENHTQILVSTTVVEVGVNVPNATVMVIYDAERFGLSQLHQLRGRVGRGSDQSYCVLIADAKSEVSQERMRIMTETGDGFKLSEHDLKLRGPGDFFGKKQSGLPEFKMADVVHDYRTLSVARDDAAALMHAEAFWKDDSYTALRHYLEQNGVFNKERLD
ncbi:ATP-dependent DNA helicase RecG [Scopulibacillus darangshiensis]|uniref:ATP-dependent DNA helicase RecG n=1 Tax=Scopulibacillus darangshiensis TaxID=442528 RepID=A0A4R2P3A1_9BACL|nr:ATP-dependent DNA helicase RecG [Scopulibacillus darangshiensis]TCP29142.1 ATP-dependent DNA helicase RecG [Scopulibacillus darangshiensis]